MLRSLTPVLGGRRSNVARAAEGPTKSMGRRGITWQEFCAAALRLPGVEAGTSYATPALFVRKKLVARLKEDGQTVAVRVDFLDRDVLLAADPKGFYLTDHYRAYPWILMRLARVRRPVALQLFEQAWRLVAPAALSRVSSGKPAAKSQVGSTRARGATARGGRRRLTRA